jgi:hypothetical protein
LYKDFLARFTGTIWGFPRGIPFVIAVGIEEASRKSYSRHDWRIPTI